ncbi:MAG: GNAT family N-acetyltransferase [Cyanobacteria bacterium QH_2_48_84]|nr:MAG: GNAT family N-acetyltransferase [Cyanobacteria bacterium QH_2_48_84]
MKDELSLRERYSFQLALSPPKVSAYFQLRHQIFCEEQRLFTGSDEDELDEIAYPIVATATDARVVGVVRIYELEPGLWYGGRLEVHRDYRRVGCIGKGLIYKAVTTANTWGCKQFLATVQKPNARFFQRLHWQSLRELTICSRPHHLMEADLDYYPPGSEPRPVLPTRGRETQAC